MSNRIEASRISRRAVLGGAGACALAGLLVAQEETPDPRFFSVESLIDGTGMAHIPAGQFIMGFDKGNDDEKPAHPVHITRAFEISKYEINQTQWKTVMAEAHPTPGAVLKNGQGAPVSATPSEFKGEYLPVESISWDDVALFLARLSARDPKHTYRLPTEAEWEYAAKAGKKAEDGSKLDARAWFKDNAGGKTHAPGQKQPNAWGLYDMEGNVAEWVQDWYGLDYYDQSPTLDPQGPKTGSYRVYRGASWLDSKDFCRTTYRGFDFPVNRFYNVGFRVVRTG